MSLPGNSPSRRPVWSLAGVVLVALAVAIALPAAKAFSQQQGIDRDVIPVAPDAPERYVVQPGDTLWDISARFLTDPWYWPEIWYVNPQVANPHLIYPGDVLALTWVDGRPRLSLESGGPMRLSPRVRESPLSGAINAIPYDQVAAFLSRPQVLPKELVKGAPYVVRGRDERLMSAEDNDIYARRFSNAEPGSRYSIFHIGEELKDPDDGDVLGYHGMYAGQANLKQAGDPATLLVVESARETTEGDILLPAAIDVKMDFIPHAPPSGINGTIISVSNDMTRTATGDHDVVITNRGARHGLEPGHVLAIWETGEVVRDKSENAVSRNVRLPEERIGLCMIFKTYDRVGYCLTLEATREVRAGDKVRAP